MIKMSNIIKGPLNSYYRITTRGDCVTKALLICEVCESTIKYCNYCNEGIKPNDDIFCDESEVIHYCGKCFDKMMKDIK